MSEVSNDNLSASFVAGGGEDFKTFILEIHLVGALFKMEKIDVKSLKQSDFILF
jgi:hypothetical protein